MDLTKMIRVLPNRIGPIQNNWYSTKMIWTVQNHFGSLKGQDIRIWFWTCKDNQSFICKWYSYKLSPKTILLVLWFLFSSSDFTNLLGCFMQASTSTELRTANLKLRKTEGTLISAVWAHTLELQSNNFQIYLQS